MDEEGSSGAGGGEGVPPSESLPPAEPVVDAPPPPLPPQPSGFPPYEPAPPSGPAGEAPPPLPTAPLGQKRHGKALWIVAAALIVAAIVAVVAIMAGGGGTKAASQSPAPSASPSAAPPGTITATVAAFSVTLTWTAPAGGSPVKSYNIWRDGRLLGSVDAPTTTYTDTSVVPGKTYSYEVESNTGEVLSGRISVAATTPVPALADARVDGTFNVVARVLTKSGYSSYPSPFTLAWQFTPKCAVGPCDVTWADLSFKQLRATFKRKGGAYNGADSGYFGGHCGSAKGVDNVTISIHVVKAKAFGGEWIVSKFTGTLLESSAPQLGCSSTSATIALTGTLTG